MPHTAEQMAETRQVLPPHPLPSPTHPPSAQPTPPPTPRPLPLSPRAPWTACARSHRTAPPPAGSCTVRQEAEAGAGAGGERAAGRQAANHQVKRSWGEARRPASGVHGGSAALISCNRTSSGKMLLACKAPQQPALLCCIRCRWAGTRQTPLHSTHLHARATARRRPTPAPALTPPPRASPTGRAAPPWLRARARPPQTSSAAAPRTCPAGCCAR